jgi:hypothetical protein
VNCIVINLYAIGFGKRRLKGIDRGHKIVYFSIMTENAAKNDKDRPSGQRPDILAGFLASALDMEDEISNSVYKDFMDLENWPAGMDMDIYLEIRKHLTTLIEDTRRHRKIVLGLMKRYGKDNAAG